MKQLSHAIKGLYGYDFDSEEYLEKIIDLNLYLKPIDKITYLKSLFPESGFDTSRYHSISIFEYIIYKNLDMRGMNRYLSTMAIYENIREEAYITKEFYLIFRYVFFPYFIGQQMFDYKKYAEFIKGKGFNDFYEYIESSVDLIKIIIHELKLEEEVGSKDLKGFIREMYDATYNTPYINDIPRIINGKQLTKREIDTYNDLCSILKNFNLKINIESTQNKNKK